MMKTQVGPGLRALGFKGSGQNYELRDAPAHWAMLGFQKSVASDAEQVRFTVNLLVVGRDDWERMRAERPNCPRRPTANTAQAAWSPRLGDLLPNRGSEIPGRATGPDAWWYVNAGQDTSEVANALVRMVEKFALPGMQRAMA
jgi:hypothetical protein